LSPDRGGSEMSTVFKEENKSRLSQHSHNTPHSIVTTNNALAGSKASKGLK
jgi:hypothetical protein